MTRGRSRVLFESWDVFELRYVPKYVGFLFREVEESEERLKMELSQEGTWMPAVIPRAVCRLVRTASICIDCVNFMYVRYEILERYRGVCIRHHRKVSCRKG